MSAETGTGWVSADGYVDDVPYVNTSGMPVEGALDRHLREIAYQLNSWRRDQEARGGAKGLFERDKFAALENPYDRFRVARDAVATDDVVGGAADAIESLSLQEVAWESENAVLADILNQVSAEVDLDSYLRVLMRELFTYSQSVTASFWERRKFVSRTRKKAASRKEYYLHVPVKLFSLDPLKVVPVGTYLFGEERLAWNATENERRTWDGGGVTVKVDPVMTELFSGVYRPSPDESAELTALGVPVDSLMEFRPDRVWRHCVTKPAYERFPDVRIASTFRHLDLKQQLMQSDRVTLVGAANYILLVKKGTDNAAALPAELQNLRENFKSIAKLPVIISDHRLSIEIITPKVDLTLDIDKYDLLDARIAARALSSLDAAGATGDAAGQTRSRTIARVLDNRRQMIRRMVQLKIRDAILKHPGNREALAEFKESEYPSLVFNPRQIVVDNDALMSQIVLGARDRRELSRHSFLEYIGMDQAVEAQRMKVENELYDEIFKSQVPYSAMPPGGGQQGDDSKNSNPNAQGSRGAEGGRPRGGGEPPRSARGVKPRTGNNASKKEG